MISLRWALTLTLLALTPAVVAGACTPSGPEDQGSGGATVIPEPGPTEICETQCIPLWPNGEWDYRALRGCLICQACADICVDQSGEMCGAGGSAETGCSSQSFSCPECIGGPCALAQNPDTTFTGTCGPLGSTCSLNWECVQLNNCVVKCIEAGVGTDGGTEGGVDPDGGQI